MSWLKKTFNPDVNNKKKITNKKEIKKIDLDRELKTAGIILIILGVLHFVLSGFLDFTWGIVLIPIGIIALFYRSRNMVLVLGILLVLLGIWNFYTNIENSMYGQPSTFWNILSFFQVYWGIKEIICFRKISENPKYVIKETKRKGFVWYCLRISLITLIILWIVEKIVTINLAFAIIEWINLLFVFVMSIIHLVVYKKKGFAILSLGVSVIVILLTSYAFIYLIFYAPNITTTTGELVPNYVVFRAFTNPTDTKEMKLEFSSNLPINVYFVPTEEDYNKFMQSEQFNTYQSCFFENQISGIINCNVSGGGIIIHNPNYQNITYTIKSD